MASSLQLPPPRTGSRPVAKAPSPSIIPDRPEQKVYGLPFWLAYASNTTLIIAVSLLFRYADFVTFLGGTELNLGWIVGVGMVGSLVMRLAQGVGIDQYGARRVWLWSAAFFTLSCLGHLWITEVNRPAVYVLRIVYCSGIAGVIGASMTYIARRAPQDRLAELVGTLGTSGFVGYLLGPVIADLLFGSGPVERVFLDRMFLVAAGLGALTFVFGWMATRKETPPARRRQPPALGLLRRYHPGPVLWIGVALGMGVGLPGTFLRTFAAELKIPRIAVFFVIFSAVAFAARLYTRSWSRKFGLKPVILAGQAVLCLGVLLFLAVGSEWQLVFPATLLGTANACLFPAIVAGGSMTFPDRYRGLGMTLVMASFDVGNLVGAPTVGVILHTSESVGMPPYPTMFVSVTAILAVATVYYALASRR